MKKSIRLNKNLLMAVLISFMAFFTNAQTLSFTASSNVLCGTTPTYILTSSVLSTYSNTAFHTWSVIPNTCGNIVSANTNSMVYQTYCPGTYTVICIARNSSSVTVGSQQQIITVNPSNAQWLASPAQTICAGNTFTMSYSGASTYTTVGPGINVTGATALLTPTANTCYSVLSSGSTCSVAVFCLSVTNLPNITVNSPTICAGNTAILFAPGAVNYTWSSGSSTTFSNAVSPTASTCYTVTGSFPNCPGTSSAVACVSVVVPPTITLTGMPACQGSSKAYTATPFSASNYTWVGTSGTTSWSAAGQTVTIPAGVTCFYAKTYHPANCIYNSNTICPTPIPSPTVSVSSSTNIVCPGDTVVMSASGATTYTWSNASMGAMLWATPMSATCFTVWGSNTFGCLGSAVSCVSVLPGPTLSILGTNSVCLGTSVTFTAGGGSGYVWNGSASGNTFNILPTTTTVITLSGVGSNGCSGMTSASLIVNANCSDVWPGDANSDGVVSASDVFEIGLGFSSTGTARSPGGNTYVAQHATNWSGSVSTGKNKCHADCNGDGTINFSDTVAIFNNFGLSHSFKPGAASTDPEITLVAPSLVFSGSWNVADVVVGNSTMTINQLYGVAFDLNLDMNLIDDAYLVYTSSFLDASNQNVEFRKNFLSNGKIVGATVRTDKSNVSGNGKIAELHFKVKGSAAPNTQLNSSISNSQKVSSAGTVGQLVPGTLSQVVAGPVGISKQQVADGAQVFPNPASNVLTIRNAGSEMVHFTITDLTGRVITKDSFVGEKMIDVSTMLNGIYFVEVQSSAEKMSQKVIINH